MGNIRFVNQKVKLLAESDMSKMIELAGRTCYKSENKITKDSSVEFEDRMIKSGHLSMLEHGTVYMTVPIPFGKEAGCCDENSEEWKLLDFFSKNPYSIVRCTGPSLFNKATGFITTNYRVIIENKKLKDYEKYKSECTRFHKKRVSFKIITSRQVSHELVRHRKFSFAQESTRYCDYTRDKFKGLTFIIPYFLKNVLKSNPEYGYRIVDARNQKVNSYINLHNEIFDEYYMLRRKGETAQSCAALLPNDTKTEIIMTGFLDDWVHFLELRYLEKTGKVLPEMKQISSKIFNILSNHEFPLLSYNKKTNSIKCM